MVRMSRRATTSNENTNEVALVLLDVSWFSAVVESRREVDASDVTAHLLAIARTNVHEDARIVRVVSSALAIASPTIAAAILSAMQIASVIARLEGFPALRGGV